MIMYQIKKAANTTKNTIPNSFTGTAAITGAVVELACAPTGPLDTALKRTIIHSP